MNLYEIKNEVDVILSQEELTEEDFAKLDELKGDAFEKMDNIGKFIKNLEANAKGFEEAEKEFKAKKQAAKNKVENLKKYSSSFLNAIGKEKLETQLFKFSFRKSTSVNIIDEEKISEDFTEIVETKKIDKTAIKNAIKDGQVVEGAELIESQNLQFK